jgi:hypothetical protein
MSTPEESPSILMVVGDFLTFQSPPERRKPFCDWSSQVGTLIANWLFEDRGKLQGRLGSATKEKGDWSHDETRTPLCRKG